MAMGAVWEVVVYRFPGSGVNTWQAWREQASKTCLGAGLDGVGWDYPATLSESGSRASGLVEPPTW